MKKAKAALPKLGVKTSAVDASFAALGGDEERSVTPAPAESAPSSSRHAQPAEAPAKAGAAERKKPGPKPTYLGETKRLTGDIPKEDFEDFKAICGATGKRIQDQLVVLVRDFITGHPRRPPRTN